MEGLAPLHRPCRSAGLIDCDSKRRGSKESSRQKFRPCLSKHLRKRAQRRSTTPQKSKAYRDF